MHMFTVFELFKAQPVVPCYNKNYLFVYKYFASSLDGLEVI